MIPMTKKELAELTGYTYRRLHMIDQELPEERKLFVKCEEGKYDPVVFVQRWVDFCVNREIDKIDDLEIVKAKHEIVKTQKTELEVARMRGSLIDVQDAKRLWGNIANTVMQNMIHLPSKIAPMLIMQDNEEVISDIIRTEIKTVLTAIADTPLPEYADVTGEDAEEEDEE